MLFGFLKKKPVQSIADNKLRTILAHKIPAEALDYVMELWAKNPFHFKMPKSRKTCLGNYRLQDGQHTVTVNGDLHPYAFLLTLIHEIAHQHVALSQSLFRKIPAPHGVEWKRTFIKLLQPLLHEGVYPADILSVLSNHMRNPASSSVKDPALVRVMAKYDTNRKVDGVFLKSIELGQAFNFKDKRYIKIEDRRTRTLVQDPKTHKRYTINSIAEVIPA